MKHLYILRHGEAGMIAASDSARELTERGKEQTATLAQILRKQGLTFDLALVSPYVRAQQTAKIVLDEFGSGSIKEDCDMLVPEGQVTGVIEKLAARQKNSILLVSHQPFVSYLIASLVNGESSAASLFPPMLTSSMACLSMDIVALGCADLKWLKSQPDFQNMAF